MCAEAIRVLIADDHAVVRQGLRLFLELQPGIEVIGEASTGREALECARSLMPNVVVMDLAMPDMDGVEATRAVKDVCPETQVLVLTSFADNEHVVPALTAGALGYLPKDVSPDEIALAVRSVRDGVPALHPDAVRTLIGRLTETRATAEATMTVLFSDVEGSTEMLSELGEVAARAVLDEHERIIRDGLGAHGGIEVDHAGDGFMMAFASARRAVRCAIDIQRAITRRNRVAAPPLRVRMGLNTGEVVARANSFYGKAVYVAARVAGLAAGGEILVSELTRSLVGEETAAFADRGTHELKGLPGLWRVFAVEWDA